MHIYVMRHGDAEIFADTDSERPLSVIGQKQSLEVAKQCQKNAHHHFDLVLVSPYLRAQQTWQTIAPVMIADKVEVCDDITPYGDSESVVEYVCALAEHQNLERVLLVSHLPLVGYLTADFVGDIPPPMFVTSGIACIDFDLERRCGELKWQIKP